MEVVTMDKPPKIPKYGNGIIIHDWMVRVLGLQGDELIIYALIHSFSKDGQSSFYGSINYMSFWTGKSKPTVLKIVKKLLVNNLIVKQEIQYTRRNKDRHYCKYWTCLSRLDSESQKELLSTTG